MKAAKRALSFALVFFMAFMALPSPARAADAVCRIGMDGYDSLGEALEAIGDGAETTITLLTDIDYYSCITVENKSIAFELEGFTLNIINEAGAALVVGDSGAVLLRWGDGERGELNAISEAGGHAVYVHDGGRASVTSATARNAGGGGGLAVLAVDDSSQVTVYGDASCINPYLDFPGAVIAAGGAKVLVEGDVLSTGNPADIGGLIGVLAMGGGSSVEVKGSVSVLSDASDEFMIYGALAGSAGTVIIDGDVTADGKGEVIGALAMGGMVFIGGDVTAGGEGEIIGALAAIGGAAILNGAITVPKGAAYIALGLDTVTGVKGEPGALSEDLLDLLESFGREDLAYDAYLVYTHTEEIVEEGDVDSFVYVKVKAGSGGGSAYTSRSMQDAQTSVTVSGSGIHELAQLIVTPLNAQSLPAALQEAAASGALILGFEITLSGGFQGELTISFPVGDAYNGQSVTILHYVNGRVETYTVVVVDGRATITVNSLSPFVVLPHAKSATMPKTGGAVAAGGFALLSLAALCGGYAAAKRRKA